MIRGPLLARLPWLAVLCLLLALVPARGQDEETTLRVTVAERMTLLNAGQPLSGVRLAYATEGQGPEQLEADAVVTDGTGVATLPAAATTRRLLVWKDGFAAAAYVVRGGGERRLALEAARPLVVTARRPDGERVAGAAVRVRVELPLGGAPDPDLDVHGFELTGTTGADGSLRLDRLDAEGLAVTVTLAGWLDGERFPVSTRDESVDVVLRRGADVSGRVVDERTLEPVRGGRARLAGREVELGADGSFRFERVPPGVHTLELVGTDFLAPAPRVLHLREAHDRADLELRVVRTAAVTGNVLLTSAEGSTPELPSARSTELTFVWPPGATVGTRRTPPEPRVETVRLDPGGGFLVRGLLPAAGVVLIVRRSGFVPAVREGLVLRSGETLEGVWIEMDAGGRLRGAVLDPEGEAVPEATIEAHVDGSDAPLVVATTDTDARGGFELAGLPAGGVRLRVVPPGDVAAAPVEEGPFDVVRGQETDAGTLRLQPGLVLRGSVRDAPEDATVVVEQDGRRLGPVPLTGGAFVVRGLAVGSARVRVLSDAPGSAPEETLDLPATVPLELAWTPVRDVVVELVDGNGGVVREAELTFRGEDDDGAAVVAGERTFAFRSSTGRAAFALPVGRHDVYARAPDGTAGRSAVIVEPPGEGPALPGVRVVLETGELLRGSVSSAASGGPVEGARVTLERESGASDGGAVSTDETGRFEFLGVAEGVVRVRVEAPGFVPLTGDPVLVRRGGTPTVGRLELRRGVVLRGRVLARNTPVAPGTLVVVVSDAGPVHEVRTDPYGRFEVDGLPAGGVSIEVTGAALGTRALRLDLPHAGEVEEVIDLDAGTRLFGLVRSTGRPEPYARIRAYAWGDAASALSGYAVATRADAHGRYELPALPPGPAELEVELAEGGVTHRFEVDVPDAVDDLLDLDLPEAWVSGQVVAASGGEPLSGAFVRLLEPGRGDGRVVAESISDGTGAFRLDRVPAGTYVLEARRAGYGALLARDFTVESGDARAGVLLSVPDEAVVEARVLTRDRRALPDGWLLAEPYGEDAPRTGRRIPADPEGRVRLDELPAGAWALSAGAPGRGSRHLGVLDLVPGLLDLGEIHLDPESALRIAVVENGLFPASGIEVEVRDLFGRDPRGPRSDRGWTRATDGRYVSDGDGHVLVTGLAPGAYEVSIAGRPDTQVTVRVGTEEITSAYLFHTPAPPPPVPVDTPEER